MLRAGVDALAIMGETPLAETAVVVFLEIGRFVCSLFKCILRICAVYAISKVFRDLTSRVFNTEIPHYVSPYISQRW